MRIVLLMSFGGWEIIPGAILFGISLYGFLANEISAEIEVIEEIAETAAEVSSEEVA